MDERTTRKQRLAAAFRLFARYGFDEGIAGHITVRDPEHKDRFWVNPLGVYFGHIRASTLICVDHSGKVVEGQRPVNRAAFAIHSRIHAARPDVVAAAHSHSPNGRAWSTLGRKLDPITQDSCAFYEDHDVFTDYGGVVNGLDEGDQIATTLATHKAVILQNHGLLTVGASVDEAVWWYITMDRSCRVQLDAQAAGEPRLIPHEVAKLTHSQIGSSMVGWGAFQPLYERIVKEEPDLLE
jgi:ribulose-5-phosphate 4-epimerase/fuculose-1-phosphate aldolase